jgi:hypothetical protein
MIPAAVAIVICLLVGIKHGALDGAAAGFFAGMTAEFHIAILDAIRDMRI